RDDGVADRAQRVALVLRQGRGHGRRLLQGADDRVTVATMTRASVSGARGQTSGVAVLVLSVPWRSPPRWWHGPRCRRGAAVVERTGCMSVCSGRERDARSLLAIAMAAGTPTRASPARVAARRGTRFTTPPCVCRTRCTPARPASSDSYCSPRQC